MNLVSNNVHLHISHPSEISDPGLLQKYESLLTDKELEKMSRFLFPRHRLQYLVTRALVRITLSHYCQLDPGELRFLSNRFGKPDLISQKRDFPIQFNLSHTNDLVVCGVVLGQDIGVDVEDLNRSTISAYKSLSRYFSAQEIKALNRLPEAAQKQRFFDYWTLKESYIKARGLGLSIPLDKFAFEFQNNSLKGIAIDPDLGDDAAAWQFWRIPIADRYLVAVAIKGGEREFRISAVKTVPLQSIDPISLDFL